jgi:prepilin-type N-terminal cleavage/methylation domain-containing protein
MILRKIKALYKNQSGFTLIEILAVLAISSIISLGALMANGQLATQTVRNRDYTTANRHVLNAIQWVSRDAQMAQDIDGAPGFPATDNLTISWTSWEGYYTQVIYSMENGHQLKRSYTVAANATQEYVVAEYINPDSSDSTWDNQELVLTLTSTVNEGTREISVTKQKTITPRPKL